MCYHIVYCIVCIESQEACVDKSSHELSIRCNQSICSTARTIKGSQPIYEKMTIVNWGLLNNENPVFIPHFILCSTLLYILSNCLCTYLYYCGSVYHNSVVLLLISIDQGPFTFGIRGAWTHGNQK